MPLITVILPTFNRAHTIERAVESVLNQTFQDFELIIVDDGSTDDTLSRLSQYEKQAVQIITLPTRKGQSAARNVGISQARSELIAFQDSDDEWLPNKLEKQVAMFRERDGRGVIYSDMEQVMRNGESYLLKAPNVIDGLLIHPDSDYYSVYAIGIQSCLFPKSYLAEVGNFNEELHAWEDLELFIRLSQKFEFYRIDVPLVKRYEVDEGVSFNLKHLADAKEALLKLYYGKLRSNPDHIKKELSDIIAFRNCTDDGRLPRIIRALKKRVRGLNASLQWCIWEASGRFGAALSRFK